MPPHNENTEATLTVARLPRLLFGALAILLTIAFVVGGYMVLGDRTSPLPKPAIMVFAVVWGVGGLVLVYTLSNWVVEQLPGRAVELLLPVVFIGPAVIFLGYFLVLPAIRTVASSFFDSNGIEFVGLANYVAVFTQRVTQVALRNNLLWLAFGATMSVLMGLVIAALADRSRFEVIAKSIIFMPVAISLVGAGVIWRFLYAVKAPGDPQIGLLNAIWTGLGNEPVGWLASNQPWNNLFLIVVVVWLQTGFAMVLLSAAIKGVPADLLDAARVDGATEIQTFVRVVVPTILPTIITVTTTIVIFTLKIFDIVVVMTSGNFGTGVIATEFYQQFFTNRDFGLGSAIAVVLLLLVLPVMVYNLRRFRQQQA
ncbi:MAG: sugar ABC transporter permease [Chloroflexota bacterium]|nr:sugar ABC transporter permease [Chloroflexota bacterium]